MKKRISKEEIKMAKDLERWKREYKRAIRKPILDREEKEILKQVYAVLGIVLYAINFVSLFASEDWRLAVQQLDVVMPIILGGLSILSIIIARAVID